ncbi:hypothetical protein C8Q76DRAFT_625473 [Earliella scabrosa]|nr:hypothetical protein C8Q76DRAFT_625473 [Earliella scabrosa]
MTKMVNALTAASEIGGPMAAMYLLKHPDHYTNHSFRTFFWKGFVYEEADKGRSRIVPISPVLDYMHRPPELEHICVYDWIRLYHKRPIPKHKKKFARPQLRTQDKEEESDEDTGHSCSKSNGALNREEEEESEDELLLTSQSNAKLAKETPVMQSNKPKLPSYYMFHASHPQAKTHEVCLEDESYSYVPNFVGGPLPRKDQGSREEYCMTMLTLFKPWRSGADLRPDENVSWDESFRSHVFTKRQEDIMKFFHIRYECNDARDDFSAQRKQLERDSKGKEAYYLSSQDLDELDTQHYRQNDLVNGDDWNNVSRAEIIRLGRSSTAEDIMRGSGWLDTVLKRGHLELLLIMQSTLVESI